MTRYWKTLVGILTLSLGAAAADAPASGGIVRTPDRLNAVLATVNGEPISLGDILPMTRSREYQAAAAYSGDTLARAVYKLRLEAVDEVIDSKLILADYSGKPFEIPEREIEAAVDDASVQMGCRSRSDLARRLREEGSSVPELRKKIKEQLIVQVMLQREYHISNFITPEDMYRYYKEHEADFSRPESVELAMLQLSPERLQSGVSVEEISSALSADPESFAELVRRYSSGPGRSDGGNLGVIEKRRLRMEFASALEGKIAVGKIYGPIETADGVFWLKVLAHHQAEASSFDASGAEIRRRMENALRRECRERYCARLRKGAIVRYFIPGAPSDSGNNDLDENEQTKINRGN